MQVADTHRRLVEALGARAPVEEYAPLVDHLREATGPLDDELILSLVATIDDNYPQAEVLDSLLDKLERQPTWVHVLFHSATSFGRRAPETYQLQVARILNGSATRTQLEDLVGAADDSTKEPIMKVVSEIALNPRERPGGSARAFLTRVAARAPAR